MYFQHTCWHPIAMLIFAILSLYLLGDKHHHQACSVFAAAKNKATFSPPFFYLRC